MPRLPRIRSLISTTVALTVAGVVATAAPAHASAPGDLDQTFGVGGVVTTDFGVNPPEPEIANEMVIQPDGKIVTAGRAGTDQFPIGGDGALRGAPYLPHRQPRQSFGTRGPGKTTLHTPPDRNNARAAAV